MMFLYALWAHQLRSAGYVPPTPIEPEPYVPPPDPEPYVLPEEPYVPPGGGGDIVIQSAEPIVEPIVEPIIVEPAPVPEPIESAYVSSGTYEAVILDPDTDEVVKIGFSTEEGAISYAERKGYTLL